MSKDIATADATLDLDITDPKNGRKLLSAVESWDELFGALAEQSIAVEEFGDGIVLLEKSELVNVEFVLTSWSFKSGDHGDYVQAFGITRDGVKFLFLDGSTGVFKQLFELTQNREAKGHQTPQGVLHVKNGIVKSEYTYTNEQGKSAPATTYYLAG